jgi:methionyl-tRNA formyltransferase
VIITLLGHFDIASLYALERVMRSMPEHDYSVFLTGDLESHGDTDPRLAELARVDGQLCEQFIAGGLAGAVRDDFVTPTNLTRPNSPEGLGTLAALEPDLVISVRYRRILQPDFIQVARHGVINLHSGILPDYRGVMATFWAMLAGEKEIGTTLHRIVDGGIDTGPVLEINRRTMRPDSSYLANVIGLYADGCDAIVRATRTIAANGNLAGEPQTAGGRYFRSPDSDALDRYEDRGLYLFDGRESLEF